MKNFGLPVAFAFLFLSLGCGGGKVGSNIPPPTNISGVWDITLSEAQSSAVGGPSPAPDGNTQIEIRLNQATIGNSVVSSTGGVYGDDIGCNADRIGNASWWAGGGWSPELAFLSGSVVNNVITFNLLESLGGFGGDPSGHLLFTGTVNADGTMSGLVSDGCVIVNGPTPATWTAKKVPALPGP